MATILILDDSATNRAIYTRLAEVVEKDVRVEPFADPLDALEWLGHNRVDLLITDFRMPHLDGAEVTRRLRALPGNAGVPVLVVTAHDDRSYRVRALDAGATDFLQTPIDHFEFVTRARNLLALGRQRPAADPAPREALLARILDALPGEVVATDRAGRCVHANAGFAAARGVDAGALAGAAAEARFGSDRAARHRAADAAIIAGVPPVPAWPETVAGRDGPARRVLTGKAALRGPEGEVVGVVTLSVAWASTGDDASPPAEEGAA